MLDIDLPGPREPALLQSLRWFSHPPLRWVERLSNRYGDTFRVRLLGPRYQSDRARTPLIARTIVILSRPAHLREIFARSRDEFLTGQAYEFLGWHTGHDSIMVLDGAAHLQERHELHRIVRHPGVTALYQGLTRDALEQAMATWPSDAELPLKTAVTHAVMDAGITCIFGPLPPTRLAELRGLVEAGAAANAVPPALLVLPFTRHDLGPFSSAHRVKQAIAQFDRFVAEELARSSNRPRTEAATRMLDTLVGPSGGSPTTPDGVRLIAQRLRLAIAGFWATGAAAAWLCFHVLRDPALRERVRSAAQQGDEHSVDFLDAVCRESLRMNLPFRGAFRRVAAATSLDGIALREGTLLLPLYALTHRRPDLYPEPDRFMPERFLERSFPTEEYAPFGGGTRHCIGEPLALLQMRLLLTGLFRAFDVRPVGTWSNAEQRSQVMNVPRDPLRARVRRR